MVSLMQVLSFREARTACMNLGVSKLEMLFEATEMLSLTQAE